MVIEPLLLFGMILRRLKGDFGKFFLPNFCRNIGLYSVCFYCIYFVTENRLIYYVQFFYVISGVFDVNWFCFGLEKFKFTTIRSVLVRLGTVAAIFLFVKERSDLVVYTTILSVGNLIAAIAVWPFVLKYLGFKKPTLGVS